MRSKGWEVHLGLKAGQGLGAYSCTVRWVCVVLEVMGGVHGTLH